ncbi:hypothetical protein LRS06_05800 [Hymenobacter sp. J193]|uniref:hypothetical protein n=1 Tax=Hymenobacter sp. J193 TaxID=2898429 RepID=UPI002151A37C|nr:hypothetical protein [Hymenobacter sp. J193]MCR5887301.1 hypothetical protein [Hymenobacter sp. J193]
MLTAKQDNRLTAAENVSAALAEAAPTYTADKALQKIRTDLDALLAALKPLRQQGLRTASQGASKTKAQRRELLATAAAEVAGDVYSYATDQQNRTLQTSADYNYSALYELRATALADLAQHIYDEATTHKTALLDYGLTPHPPHRAANRPHQLQRRQKRPAPAHQRGQSRPPRHQRPVRPARHPARRPPRTQPAQIRPLRPRPLPAHPGRSHRSRPPRQPQRQRRDAGAAGVITQVLS